MVGETLNAIGRQDAEILDAVIEVMETEQLLDSPARVDILPAGASMLVQLGDKTAAGT